MRERHIDLFGLESRDSIRNFDFIGFTLQYEMSYTGVLNMLELAGVPLLAKDRDDSCPIVVAAVPVPATPNRWRILWMCFRWARGKRPPSS